MTFDKLFDAVVIAFLVEAVIKVGFLFYIPQNRKPNAAIAWLLVLFLLPWIGIILFLLIGNPKLSKRRRSIQLEIDNLISDAINATASSKPIFSSNARERYEPIARLSESLGKLPVRGNNSVSVLSEYDLAISDITKAIYAAKEFVHLEYFIIAIDDATRPLFKALEDAIHRGVKVRVLMDAVGYRRYPNRKELTKLLSAIGADWHLMLPIKFSPSLYNRPDLRNHRKVVVIDDNLAYIGSQNIIDKTYHRKDSIFYEELVVRLSGPIVRQCNVIFASDWYAETGEALTKLLDPKYRPLPVRAGKVTAQMLPSGPSYDLQNNAALFTYLFNIAQKQIYITNPYFVPTESMLEALISAVKRGVEVIMINSEVMEQVLVGHAQRSYYRQLMSAGVNIYLYKPPVLLHSKHITIDNDIAVIGSSNLDIRSFELDLECTLITYDPSVVTDLRKVQNLDLKNSVKLSLSSWQKRSVITRLLDSLARLTSALQ